MNYIKKFESYIGAEKSILTKNKERKYKTALELEKRGADQEAIRIATGWFRNPYDKKWRFENDNFNIKIKLIPGYIYSQHHNSIKIALKYILNNTSLFKEYPQLKNISIIFRKDSDNTTNGSWDSTNKEITINNVRLITHEIEILKNNIDNYNHKIQYPPAIGSIDRMTGEVITSDILEEKIRQYEFYLKQDEYELKKLEKEDPFKLTSDQVDTLIHEIQHAIQDIEDFPRGSNPRKFKDVSNIDIEFKNAKEYYFSKYPDLQQAFDNYENNKSEVNWNKYDELSKKYGYYDEMERIWSLDLKKITPFEQYYRTAGEIEARDIASRRTTHSKGGFEIFNFKISKNPLKYFSTKFDALSYLNKIKNNDFVLINNIKMKPKDLTLVEIDSKYYLTYQTSEEPIKFFKSTEELNKFMDSIKDEKSVVINGLTYGTRYISVNKIKPRTSTTPLTTAKYIDPKDVIIIKKES